MEFLWAGTGGHGHLWAGQLWPKRQGYVRTGQPRWNHVVDLGVCDGSDESVPREEGLLFQKEGEWGCPH